MHIVVAIPTFPTLKLGVSVLRFALSNLYGVPCNAPSPCVVCTFVEFALPHHCECLEKQQPH
jgi:hypothetical protein